MNFTVICGIIDKLVRSSYSIDLEPTHFIPFIIWAWIFKFNLVKCNVPLLFITWNKIVAQILQRHKKYFSVTVSSPAKLSARVLDVLAEFQALYLRRVRNISLYLYLRCDLTFFGTHLLLYSKLPYVSITASYISELHPYYKCNNFLY